MSEDINFGVPRFHGGLLEHTFYADIISGSLGIPFTPSSGENPELWLVGADGIFQNAFNLGQVPVDMAAIGSLFETMPFQSRDKLLAWIMPQLELRGYDPPEHLEHSVQDSRAWHLVTINLGMSVRPTVNELADDQIGGWNKVVGSMGDYAATFKARYLAYLLTLNSGVGPSMWDGVQGAQLPLFYNRVNGTAGAVFTGNNIKAQTGTSVPAIQQDIIGCHTLGATFVDTVGNPLFDFADVRVMYGRGLKGLIEPAVDAKIWTGGSTNPLVSLGYGLDKLIYNPFLAGNGFYFIGRNRQWAPFLDLVREPFSTYQNPYHIYPDDGGYVVYGMKGRYNQAASNWWYIIHCGSNTGPSINMPKSRP